MRIENDAFDAVVAHARDCAPHECCGLLIGTGARVDAAYRSRNLEPAAARFRIDPRDHFGAIRAARVCGRRVVGVYHSHPSTPARPSATDLAEATYAEYLYVIVSLRSEPAEVRLFRLVDGRFVEEPLTLP